MVNDFIEKTMVYCVQQQNIIIQSLFLSKHFPTDRPNRPTAVQGYQGTITKVPRLFKVPCEFPWSWLCSLKCYDLFVATDNICAQRGTTLNYECRVQVTNFQIFSFVYHSIKEFEQKFYKVTVIM